MVFREFTYPGKIWIFATAETISVLKREQPEIVINAAGRSGGVTYNKNIQQVFTA